ncbi:WD40 repeat-like protein [Suillus hirtellus]|nr:WD40 repeat-like protein [Suillus hirtellus]
MAESSTSAKRREGEQGAMLNSPVTIAPHRTREKDPPPYGAQHHQDALWEGGRNGALPPLWCIRRNLEYRMSYQDDTIVMASWNRPLPGVRLDFPGKLAPGCEWHISPLGRSYFVNHNTKTTSWKKPVPERPPECLTPECMLEGHSKVIWSLVHLGTGWNILSASEDGSIGQWTIDGEAVGKHWISDGRPVCSIAMSPDESMVVSASSNDLRLWNIRKGVMVGEPWKGHDDVVRSIDWSPNGQEIASGSEDGTIRRWNPDTGRQITTIETGHGTIYAVKYSPQGDKFMSGQEDKVICIWSKDGKLLMEIEGHERQVTSLCWSKDGAHIFSASVDHTIRKWRSIDGKELVVFRGHTNDILSLCLSPDERHLVSASHDYSVRIWDLKTNRPVGDPLLHDDEIWVVVISPDGKYIASAGSDGKIYVWSLEAALKHTVNNHSGDEGSAKVKGHPVRSIDAILHASQASKQRPQAVNKGSARYGNDFWDADTNPTPPFASPSSSLHWRNFLDSLRFSIRPPNASIPLQHRRWNLKLFPGGSSIRTVEVAAGRKKNRIYVSPPSAAELARAEAAAAAAAAAAQHTNGNEAGSSTQAGQPQAVSGTQASQGRPAATQPGPSLVVPGTQVSQGQPIGTQRAGDGTEVSCEVRCCGLFFSCGSPSSHQS